jgi:putative transposase
VAAPSDIRTGGHCVFIRHARWVFITKYRHRVFGPAHLKRMEQIMRDVCAEFGAELSQINGDAGHVHLRVNFPPAMAISRLVNSRKGVSSRRLRQEFPDLRSHYRRATHLWSGSYFAGWAPSSALHQYIKQQTAPPHQHTGSLSVAPSAPGLPG